MKSCKLFSKRTIEVGPGRPRHNPARNWPDTRPNWRQWPNPFFFKSQHKSGRLSGQELTGFKAGFWWTVSRADIFQNGQNFLFFRYYLKNHNSLSESPKLENFVPFETSSKVLKIPRRHFSMIPSGRHSKIGSKLMTWVIKTDLGWFSAKFGNSAKFTHCKLASEIWNSIRVSIQV